MTTPAIITLNCLAPRREYTALIEYPKENPKEYRSRYEDYKTRAVNTLREKGYKKSDAARIAQRYINRFLVKEFEVDGKFYGNGIYDLNKILLEGLPALKDIDHNTLIKTCWR